MPWVDLLKADEFRRYVSHPECLRQELEAKSSATITSDHLKGLRQLVVDHPHAGRRVVVCREPKPRMTPDGIELLPAAH